MRAIVVCVVSTMLSIVFISGCTAKPKLALNQQCSTTELQSSDWGPSYVSGMEHGPASQIHSIAVNKAELFLAKQPYASQYAKRACSARGDRPLFDVGFSLLQSETGHTKGIVRVNIDTGECVWLGVIK
jgi:hypothetical protein